MTDWAALRAALLDFEQAPGRYATGKNEPEVVFAHRLTVLQLAAGRQPAGVAQLSLHDTQEADLRRAARYFVRTVHLRPGADDHTVLGLTADCTEQAVREHYRLMIRMAHPDFAGDGPWPPDTAARINRARGALAMRSDKAQPKAHAIPAEGTGHATRQDRRRRWRAWAWLGGGAGLAAVALLVDHGGQEHSLAVRRVVSVPVPRLEAAVSLGTAGDDARAMPAVEAAPAQAASPDALDLHLSKRLQPQATPPAGLSDVVRDGPPQVQQGVPIPLQPVVTGEREVALALPVPPALQATQVQALSGPEGRDVAPVRLALGDVQPTLSGVLGSLPGAQGATLLRWVHDDFRQSAANRRFVQQLDGLLMGQEVLQVQQVQLQARRAEGQLVVDGVVRLRLQDVTRQPVLRELSLRAYFEGAQEEPQLVQLATDGWR